MDEPDLTRGGNHAGRPRASYLRHDRAIVSVALAAITVLSWVYLVRMAAMMNASAAEKTMHAAMGMPEMAAWGAAELIMLFLMWTVMMIAMMLPSAAPIILLVVGTYRRRGALARILTLAFGSGYLSRVDRVQRCGRDCAARAASRCVFVSGMASNSAIAAGAILLLAGTYQWLPIKRACLTHCRSPLDHLTREWREGVRGAFIMGLRHGLYCVGCCWALMILLFAAGVMNLLWVAGIAVFVLVEKLAPQGARLGKFAGAALIAWGGLLLARGF